MFINRSTSVEPHISENLMRLSETDENNRTHLDMVPEVFGFVQNLILPFIRLLQMQMKSISSVTMIGPENFNKKMRSV